MNNITSYNEFLTEATSVSSVSGFLKTQYNKIFQNPNKSLHNLFNDFTKKVDREKNISNLYDRYIKANQTFVQNEINNAESIDAVNKIVTDNIKYFYFSLKPIINKLQNNEFTMQSIFERSRDKRLQKLMSYPEDQFSNAVSQYAGEIAIPAIKTDSGIDKKEKTEQPEQTQAQAQPEESNEMRRIRGNIYKIFEADGVGQQEDLAKYKRSAINWLNTSLYDLLKPKRQLLNQLGASVSGDVDSLARTMKGTMNMNAKKIILNKVINSDREGLINIAKSLGLSEDEIGKL